MTDKDGQSADLNSTELFLLLLSRGLSSDLATRLSAIFPNWNKLRSASKTVLKENFSVADIAEIQRAKSRREIPVAIVQQLVDACNFRCCLCWNIDTDDGVVLHHIESHSSSLNDSYENLIVVCPNHHSQIHTKWELARHPYPPQVLKRRKHEFEIAIAAFKSGSRPAPGRESTKRSRNTCTPPPAPRAFIGRIKLKQSVFNALLSKSARVALVGMGGVGKTALSLKVAEKIESRFPGGSLWVDGLSPTHCIEEVLTKIASAIGYNIENIERASIPLHFANSMQRHVDANGRLLLLVDDVHESAADALVVLCSSIPPEVSLLLTTRDAAVAAAADAEPHHVDPLERSTSTSLLSTLSHMTFVNPDDESPERLLSQLGDLPLAIELVARNIALRRTKPGFTIRSICDRLDSFDERLLSFPGHRSIAKTFQLSYDSMLEDDRAVFHTIGVFPHAPFRTIDIAGVSGRPQTEIETSLDRLVDASVVIWGGEPSEYRIHPLLHSYSAHLVALSSPAEVRDLQSRFSKHFLKTAIKSSEASPADLLQLDQIADNLSVAIQISNTNGEHHAVATTIASICVNTSFFGSRLLKESLVCMLEAAAMAAKETPDATLQSTCISHLGNAYARLGRVSEAADQFKLAITITRTSGNDYDLSSNLQNLGTVLLMQGDRTIDADAHLREGLKIAKRVENIDAAIGCLSALGNLYRQLWRLNEAAEMYKAALDASALINNELSCGNNLSNLGLAIAEQGRMAEGMKMIEEALEIAKKIGDRRGEGNRIGHLGGFNFQQAMRTESATERERLLATAKRFTQDAIDIAEETNDPQKAATWIMNIALIHSTCGEMDASLACLDEALQIASRGGYFLTEVQVRFNLGIILLRLGQLNESKMHLAKAGTLALQIGSPLAPHIAKAFTDVSSELAKLRSFQ